MPGSQTSTPQDLREELGNPSGTLDLAGSFQGQNFLVLVGAFSKWVEVVLMASTISEAITQALRKIFATHGLPDLVVSDNGPQFTSSPFEVFLEAQKIHHTLTAPFHPSSNGQAEGTAHLAKDSLGKMGPGDWHAKMAWYLFPQHATPCPLTNHSPAKVLMGCQLRTTLDRLHLNYVQEKLQNLGGRIWEFAIGAKSW